MSHAEALERENNALKIAIVVNVGIMVLEAVGGIVSNSLALLSDAWHMLTDVLAMSLCLLAGTITMKPPTSDKTYGFHRVEVVSAFVNGIALVAVALYIFYEAALRMLAPGEVHTIEMLAVAVIGLSVNLISMTLLSRVMLSINVKGALLHVTGDAVSSVGVVTAGVVILLTGWYFVDTIAGVIVGSIVLYGTSRMLREVVHILLEGVPRRMKMGEIVKTIKGVKGVVDVHDAHVWSITSYMHYLSAHIVVGHDVLKDAGGLLNQVKERLQEEYGIRHTTIQLETEDYREVGEVHKL